MNKFKVEETMRELNQNEAQDVNGGVLGACVVILVVGLFAFMD